MLPDSLKEDFPLLQRKIAEQPVTYLDSAATGLKPQAVIDSVNQFYTSFSANVHRSVHQLSEEATDAYEATRESLAFLLNADSREIAFVRNATEAFNIVAKSAVTLGKVAIAPSEHHSNLLPWRQGDFFYLPLQKDGTIDLQGALALIAEQQPAVLALSMVSNALGVKNPVKELVAAARACDAIVVLDASQAVGHYPLDVRELDCDYLCFSAHKMLGPSGVGILYQSEQSKLRVSPWLLGGEMIHEAHLDGFEPRPFPWALEAGTPNIEGVIGTGAAAEYLMDIDPAAIELHCQTLSAAIKDVVAAQAGFELVTPRDAEHTSIVTFRCTEMGAHAVSRVLSNRFSLMLRSGFHCAQPLHEIFDSAETLRASVHLYNSMEDVERLKVALAAVLTGR